MRSLDASRRRIAIRLFRLFHLCDNCPRGPMPVLKTSLSNVSGESGQLRTLRRLVQLGSTRVVGKGGESVEIPATVRNLLAEIARNMEAGKAVTVVAEHHELTT